MLERTAACERSTLASLVLVRVHELVSNPDPDEPRLQVLKGYVFVIDQAFGANAVYKLAGGHEQTGESPLRTAQRELKEETNLRVSWHDFRECGKWLETREYGTHWKYLFTADVDVRKLHWVDKRAKSKRQEKPKFCTVDEFYALVRSGKFMPDHYKKLVEYALVLPGGRDKPGRDS